MRDAACRDLDLADADRVFFPIEVLGDDTVWDAARALCGTCPVTAECAAFATDMHANHGMWGGLTPVDRGIDEGTRAMLPCGTYASWHRGCRCDECVTAKRTYTREQMRRQRRKKSAA